MLMRHLLLAWLPGVACLSAALCLAPSAPRCSADEPVGRERDIDALVAQLGSEDFEAREAATRRLMEREDAAAALRRALKSPDHEVARRAREILDTFVRREKERAFNKLADLAKHGAVDQAIEKFVRRDKWDDETACWQVMAKLGGKLTDLERQAYGKASLRESQAAPIRDFRRYVAAHGGESREFKIITARRPSADQVGGTCVIRAEEIPRGNSVAGSLITSCGGVKLGDVMQSVIFAGGSVDVSGAHDSLIVCDGDFTAGVGLLRVLVIARGTVRCPSIVEESRIIAGGGVQYAARSEVLNTKVKEKETNPLGFIKFFDPAEVGIKVESAEGGVRVREAAKDKPFATAGLRAGDLVTALDGAAVKDAEGFRRLLRAKVAVEGTTTFHVRRDQKTLEIPVTHKD
jgi:hypothetical protein